VTLNTIIPPFLKVINVFNQGMKMIRVVKSTRNKKKSIATVFVLYDGTAMTCRYCSAQPHSTGRTNESGCKNGLVCPEN
jgi:hypothetical protein